MTHETNSSSPTCLPPACWHMAPRAISASVLLAAVLMLCTGAQARPAPHGGGARSAAPQRGGDYRGNRGGGGWGGGYERAPPVVYGSPYYAPYSDYPYAAYPYPPPLIYGPGIGISVPGIVIGGY